MPVGWDSNGERHLIFVDTTSFNRSMHIKVFNILQISVDLLWSYKFLYYYSNYYFLDSVKGSVVRFRSTKLPTTTWNVPYRAWRRWSVRWSEMAARWRSLPSSHRAALRTAVSPLGSTARVNGWAVFTVFFWLYRLLLIVIKKYV